MTFNEAAVALKKAGHPAPTRGHLIVGYMMSFGKRGGKIKETPRPCDCAVCNYLATGKMDLQADRWCSRHFYCGRPCPACAEEEEV